MIDLDNMGDTRIYSSMSENPINHGVRNAKPARDVTMACGITPSNGFNIRHLCR